MTFQPTNSGKTICVPIEKETIIAMLLGWQCPPPEKRFHSISVHRKVGVGTWLSLWHDYLSLLRVLALSMTLLVSESDTIHPNEEWDYQKPNFNVFLPRHKEVASYFSESNSLELVLYKHFRNILQPVRAVRLRNKLLLQTPWSLFCKRERE